jgi:hypothetical protein
MLPFTWRFVKFIWTQSGKGSEINFTFWKRVGMVREILFGNHFTIDVKPPHQD